MNQKKMSPTKKLAITAMLCSIAVVSSHFLSLPLGVIRAFPVQHLVNVLLAVLVGTKLAVSGAFVIALIRNILGLGSLFAFPGSLIGAFLAGVIYEKTNRLALAALGEALGTGIIGSLLSYPIATFILGQEVTLFFVFPSFLTSSLVGSTIGYLLLKSAAIREIALKEEQV